MRSISSLWCRLTVKVALQANDSAGFIQALCHWHHYRLNLPLLLKGIELDAYQANCLKQAMYYLEIKPESPSAQKKSQQTTIRDKNAALLWQVCAAFKIPDPKLHLDPTPTNNNSELRERINTSLENFTPTRHQSYCPNRQILSAISVVIAKEMRPQAPLISTAIFMFTGLLYQSYHHTTCLALVGIIAGLTYFTEQPCRKRLLNISTSPIHRAPVGK